MIAYRHPFIARFTNNSLQIRKNMLLPISDVFGQHISEDFVYNLTGLLFMATFIKQKQPWSITRAALNIPPKGLV